LMSLGKTTGPCTRGFLKVARTASMWLMIGKNAPQLDMLTQNRDLIAMR